MFELTKDEQDSLRSQFATLKKRGTHSKYLIMAFSEHGILMLSSVLRSETAVNVGVQIINAFVEMRRFLKDNAEVFLRLENVERKQSMLQNDSDKKFEQVFNALESHNLKPKQGIFYDGQVFDAYTFIADLIRDAKHSIVLIG